MPLDIDGAGRSRSLACFPTARGTVAREARYLEEFFSALIKVNTLNPVLKALAGFVQGGS